MSPTFNISPIKDLTQFLADWQSLLPENGGASFFQSKAWVESWLTYAKNATSLFQIRSEDADGLLLLGVFGQRNIHSMPIVGTNEVRLGEACHENYDSVYIEYNDFLIRAGEQGDIRRHACLALFNQMNSADSFVFRNVVPPLRHSIIAACTDRDWAPRVIHEGATFAIKLLHLRDDNETVLSRVSSNTRRQIERSMRLYEERGELQVHRANSKQERENCWQELDQLHAKAWQARGQSGAFASQQFQDFHKILRENHAQKLDFLTITAGDETIGCFYNFLHNGTVMNYQSGFKYEQNNQLKPGLVSHVLAAQFYLKNDYDLYDMLVGDARYKQSLGEPLERLSVIEVERPGVKRTLRKTVRNFRKMKERRAR